MEEPSNGLEERLAKLESDNADQAARLTSLESWRAWSYGVVAIVSGLLAWLLSMFDGRGK